MSFRRQRHIVCCAPFARCRRIANRQQVSNTTDPYGISPQRLGALARYRSASGDAVVEHSYGSAGLMSVDTPRMIFPEIPPTAYPIRTIPRNRLMDVNEGDKSMDNANWRGTATAMYRWISGREPLVLAALLVLTLCTWGFIELTDEVLEGSTREIDIWLLQALRQPGRPELPLGPPWLGEIGRDVTALGGVFVLVLFSAAVTVFLLLDGKRHAALFLAVAALSGIALSFSLKGVFRRPRPDVVPHLSHVATSSFPSGHAMMSAIIYLTLGALLAAVLETVWQRVYVLGLAVLLTVLVGISRVYMGVHYPTDVLAGWAAGLTWALLCWLAARWLQRRGQIEQPEPEPE